MLSQSLFLVVCLSAVGNERPIDTFQYADTASAQQAWAATAGTPPAEMVSEGGRRFLQFAAPFARDATLPRTILDRKVDLDLAAVGQFALQIAADPPEAVGHVSLYFHSGDGWYAAGQGLHTKGWQTLEFSKASFRTEDRPAGWHKVDAIRISVWRGQGKDASVRLGRLSAWWHDVALVIPAAHAHGDDREIATALHTAELVGEMLNELGLGSDAVEDTALSHGALGQRRVALLAYNPRLPDEAVAVLERFVDSGGKVLVCYTLPPRLGKAMGFERGRYLSDPQPGYFAEIRFDAADIPGLPKAARQASWNITTAEPAGHNARVIGRWFQADGKPTGLPAMLVSDRGAYLSHILLPDDRPAKKQLLAAVLGWLSPPLWQRMAESELARIDRVGHCDTLAQVAELVNASRKNHAIERLQAALATKQAAEARCRQKAYPEAVDQARAARELLAEAYLRAMPSPTCEGRAFWNHSGTGAYPGDWDRTAKELAAAGFNMVLPNMLWAGVAHYASDVLPRSKTFDEHGDQIAQCVAAAKKHGLEVHVWKVNYNLSTAPREFVDKLRAEGRLQVTVRGKPEDWLCPSHPENLRLELESMLEVARNYEVDGLHFDYIRYPHGDCCYCEGCRDRFQADTGRNVAQWPQECYDGPLRELYRQWRCQRITRLVAAVRHEAKKIKPAIKISAAVFGAYPDCRESVGQDWVEWIKAGYLDFVCPMDYTQSDLQFSSLVSNQLKLVEGRIPVYPGIGAWRLGTADRVVAQIYVARSLGAPGFTVFNLDEGAARDLLPGISLGAGSQRATVPGTPRPGCR